MAKGEGHLLAQAQVLLPRPDREMSRLLQQIARMSQTLRVNEDHVLNDFYARQKCGIGKVVCLRGEPNLSQERRYHADDRITKTSGHLERGLESVLLLWHILGRFFQERVPAFGAAKIINPPLVFHARSRFVNVNADTRQVTVMAANFAYPRWPRALGSALAG